MQLVELSEWISYFNLYFTAQAPRSNSEEPVRAGLDKGNRAELR